MLLIKLVFPHLSNLLKRRHFVNISLYWLFLSLGYLIQAAIRLNEPAQKITSCHQKSLENCRQKMGLIGQAVWETAVPHVVMVSGWGGLRTSTCGGTGKHRQMSSYIPSATRQGFKCSQTGGPTVMQRSQNTPSLLPGNI